MPTDSRANGPRRLLMEKLAEHFEALHSQSYTVSKPNQASRSGAPPEGPALDWTRGLFRLMAERAGRMEAYWHAEQAAAHAHNQAGISETLTAAAPDDAALAADFRELVDWAAKGDAAAKLIHRPSWWAAWRARLCARHSAK